MIYLDYAANTPVDEQVMDIFIEDTKRYFGNPNSIHEAGRLAKARMQTVTDELANLLNVKPEEIIYTSGSSESNNLAIKGVAKMNRNQGKHIISSSLEHSSVSGALTALQNDGYEIDLVDILDDGTIDLEHLEELLRKDTILVSICAVDSELGVVQPIEKIAELIKKKSNAVFHTDATQAVGKIKMDFTVADLISFTPHKFFGLNGSGILIKRQNVVIEPLIHGGVSTTMYRSGTPCVALASATLKALELVIANFDERFELVSAYNQLVRDKVDSKKGMRVNSPIGAVPHILNISIAGIKAGAMQKKMDELGIMISTKSACSVPNTPSRPVYAVTHDKKNAMCSWRVSFSHLTTKEEVEEFLNCMNQIYNSKQGD